jgi:hypothetical protein
MTERVIVTLMLLFALVLMLYIGGWLVRIAWAVMVEPRNKDDRYFQ